MFDQCPEEVVDVWLHLLMAHTSVDCYDFFCSQLSLICLSLIAKTITNQTSFTNQATAKYCWQAPITQPQLNHVADSFGWRRLWRRRLWMGWQRWPTKLQLDPNLVVLTQEEKRNRQQLEDEDDDEDEESSEQKTSKEMDKRIKHQILS